MCTRGRAISWGTKTNGEQPKIKDQVHILRSNPCLFCEGHLGSFRIYNIITFLRNL